MAKTTSPTKEILYKVVGLLIGVALIFSYRLIAPRRAGAMPVKAAAPLSSPAKSGVAAIMEAFEAQKSGIPVEASGAVTQVLADDTSGTKHQRFILTLDNGHALLLAHDTDIAAPVPAKVGDRLEFRGQYEWNDKGGIIHWTHHDPEMRHQDGWVKLDGKAYR